LFAENSSDVAFCGIEEIQRDIDKNRALPSLKEKNT